ncbi:hypothetical protein [Leucobacter luti]|uniref:hypothetical protein n=1 Tax=Leucobacter luti TaxID=340320 RepID=UPI001C68A90F|nr:hypothetical protein [Leucobacter luti]QYM77476.1 hypothetical protein K1X41_06935 [Leucobacter luti]
MIAQPLPGFGKLTHVCPLDLPFLTDAGVSETVSSSVSSRSDLTEKVMASA